MPIVYPPYPQVIPKYEADKSTQVANLLRNYTAISTAQMAKVNKNLNAIRIEQQTAGKKGVAFPTPPAAPSGETGSFTEEVKDDIQDAREGEGFKKKLKELAVPTADLAKVLAQKLKKRPDPTQTKNPALPLIYDKPPETPPPNRPSAELVRSVSGRVVGEDLLRKADERYREVLLPEKPEGPPSAYIPNLPAPLMRGQSLDEYLKAREERTPASPPQPPAVVAQGAAEEPTPTRGKKGRPSKGKLTAQELATAMRRSGQIPIEEIKAAEKDPSGGKKGSTGRLRALAKKYDFPEEGPQ